MDNMLYHINAQRLRPGSGASLDILNAAEARRARRFHAGFAQYAPTPLVPLPYLASTLGLGNIRAKDESKRFGLNAFKVLGASYAMGRYLAERLGKSIDDLTPADLCSPAVSERLGPITFVSATDGNQGVRSGAAGEYPQPRRGSRHHGSQLRRRGAPRVEDGLRKRLDHGAGHGVGRL